MDRVKINMMKTRITTKKLKLPYRRKSTEKMMRRKIKMSIATKK
jgi:hypothetical protein